MIALSLHNIIDELLFLFLLNCFAGLILRGLWRAEGIRRAGSNQDMPRVHLFFRLAVFWLRAAFFDLDDVKTKLAFNDIANLTWL